MSDSISQILSGHAQNHVLPFFWQKDDTTDAQIIDYIDQMANANIQEFCVESRPFTGFLEAPWWQRMQLILARAKQHHMRVWILDDRHFPTGFANGATKAHPELRKVVLKHHVVNAIGPASGIALHLHQPYPLDPDAKFLAAVAVQGDQTSDLGHDTNGDYLYFDLPAGRWDIDVMLISHTTDVAEDYINMCDRASCRLLIDTVYEPHFAHFQAEFGHTIAGFFSDEPGFQNEKGVKSDSLIGKDMPLPWSNAVEAALKQAWGQNYQLNLPHLWHQIGAQTPLIRRTYMDVVTNLYQHNFTEQIGDWCRAHHVMYIGHIIEDRESHARLGVGPGHYFRALSGQDMAGSDIISNQLMPGLDTGDNMWARGKWDGEFFHYFVGKLTSSLAHITPRMHGRAMCEVFGAYGWHEGLPLMKWIIDHQVAQGLNYFVPHAFSPATFPDPDCPPHFYANGHNPQFVHFGQLMAYTNALSSLFDGGQTHPEAAVVYHAEGEWTGDYLSAQKPARVLTQHHVDFDILPNDVFSEDPRYAVDLAGHLQVNGHVYPLLIVPYAQYIPSALYRFITEATATQIVFVGGFPSGLSDEQAHFDSAKLQRHSQNLSLNELGELVDTAGLAMLRFGQAQPHASVLRYYKDKQPTFFVVNEDPIQPLHTTVHLPHAHQLYRIDLITNRAFALPQDGILDLAPLESCVLVSSIAADIPLTTQQATTHQIVLTADAQLSLATAESPTHFDTARTLHGYPDITRHIAPGFAGTMRYRIGFSLPEALPDVRIQLNRVSELATLTVNGTQIGTRIAAPYCFDHLALPKGENELIIDVVNILDKAVYEKHSAAVISQPSGLLAPVKLIY